METKQSENKAITWTLLAVVFLSYLGFSLPYPILPALFLNVNSNLVSYSLTNVERSFLFGAAIAVYSCGQLVGSYLIGTLSDRFGRKPLLSLSLIGSIMGYLLSAISIANGVLWLFFLGRILNGFSEASAGIAQATFADLATDEDRVKKFSMINSAASLAWVLGPPIGGVLASYSIFGFEKSVSLFVIPCLLGLGMLGMVAYFYPESASKAKREPRSLGDIFKFQSSSSLKLLFATNLFIVMGFACFQYFFAPLLMKRFGSEPSDIGIIWGGLSLFWVLAQQLLTVPMTRKFGPTTSFRIFAFVLALSLCTMAWVESYSITITLIPLIGCATSVCFTTAVVSVSNHAPTDRQGQILGFNRSVHSLGKALPTMIAGILSGYGVGYPMLLGCLFVISSVAISYRFSTVTALDHN